jgi:hypothetical protein
MLTQVEVFNSRVITPPFALGAGTPMTDPIQIRGIEGLGPVDAEISTSPFGSFDGEWYQGSSVGKRNIVLTIGLNPNWATQTIEGLRSILYSYFMPKSKIRLEFSGTHIPKVQITGYVESCEPNIFSKDPEMVVSIVCPSPHFTAVTATTVTGNSVSAISSSRTDIEYQGTAETGFLVYLEKGAAADMGVGSEIQLVMENPLAQIFLIKNALVDATQYLEISTVSGSKYAKRVFTTPSPKVNILGGVAPSSTWVKLQPGLNRFAVTANASGGPWTMIYYAKFGGL